MRLGFGVGVLLGKGGTWCFGGRVLNGTMAQGSGLRVGGVRGW